MRKFLPVACLLTMSACVEPVVVDPTLPFSAEEVAYINQRGSALIEGQAFMRQQGGVVVTCAGEEVRLTPAGGYATQRMQGLYDSTTSGFRSIYSAVQADDSSAEYQNYSAATRKTNCDAQGNFRFEGVANGDYFVTTQVRWMAGSAPQGGVLMQRVNIRDGQSQRTLLSA